MTLQNTRKLKGNVANLTNAGKGRKKGVLNKTTKLAKEAIHEAFEELGGTEALVKWAKDSDENKRVFYAQIWPKIIPLQVHTDGQIEHNHTHAPAGLSDALAWLTAARGEASTATH